MADETQKTDTGSGDAPEATPQAAPEAPAKPTPEKPAPAAPAAETTAPADAAPAAAASDAPAAPAAAAPEGAAPAAAPQGRRDRRGRGAVPVGVAHIKATFNNTIVSIADTHGGVIAWSSAGRSGFKGSRKSTSFAATTVAQDAARQAVTRGMHEIEVRMQGAGAGRESAIRALQSSGLNIVMIKDVTSIPHNGCRARKRRRV